MTQEQAKIIYKAVRSYKCVISVTIPEQVQKAMLERRYIARDKDSDVLKVTKRGLAEASEYFGDLRPLLRDFM